MPRVLLAIAFVTSGLVAQAAPTKITNEDAFALFESLSQIQPGLTASNVGAAAENIWALKGVAEAFNAVQIRANSESQKAAASKDPISAKEAVEADFANYRTTLITVELQPLSLSDDEIKEAKITPAIYSPILHYLSPPKK